MTLMHARPDLLSCHVRIDERTESRSAGSKQSRRAETRRLGVLPVRFSHGGSAPERHGAGHAEVEKQLSKEGLIVDVRIEQSWDDEFSRQVENGNTGRNRRRSSSEGGDLVSFDHDHGVGNSGSRHDIDGRCTRQRHAIHGGWLLRKNKTGRYRHEQGGAEEKGVGFYFFHRK